MQYMQINIYSINTRIFIPEVYTKIMSLKKCMNTEIRRNDFRRLLLYDFLPISRLK